MLTRSNEFMSNLTVNVIQTETEIPVCPQLQHSAGPALGAKAGRLRSGSVCISQLIVSLGGSDGIGGENGDGQRNAGVPA